MTSLEKIQQALRQWAVPPRIKWDISATWHVPNAMREKYGGWDDRWHECEMRKYLNAVDRRIYKAANKNRGVRVYRWMAMERAGGVGWHSHGLLQTPPHMSDEEFVDVLQNLWHKHCNGKKVPRFASKLFKAELVKRDFFGYTIKGIFDLSEDADGVYEAHNTVLPKL